MNNIDKYVNELNDLFQTYNNYVNNKKNTNYNTFLYIEGVKILLGIIDMDTKEPVDYIEITYNCEEANIYKYTSIKLLNKIFQEHKIYIYESGLVTNPFILNNVRIVINDNQLIEDLLNHLNEYCSFDEEVDFRDIKVKRSKMKKRCVNELKQHINLKKNLLEKGFYE